MIREFKKKWEQDYLIKTTGTLQAVTDRRNTDLEKNDKRYVRRLSTLRRKCETVEVMTTKRTNLRTKMRIGRGLDFLSTS
jgi:hypothetical protein